MGLCLLLNLHVILWDELSHWILKFTHLERLTREFQGSTSFPLPKAKLLSFFRFYVSTEEPYSTPYAYAGSLLLLSHNVRRQLHALLIKPGMFTVFILSFLLIQVLPSGNSSFTPEWQLQDHSINLIKSFCTLLFVLDGLSCYFMTKICLPV